MATLEAVKIYICQSCEEIIPEDRADEAGPLYECGDCGTQFTRANSANDNHQCPDCNKFASKLADRACPDCEEGALDEQDGFSCGECEALFTADELRRALGEHEA